MNPTPQSDPYRPVGRRHYIVNDQHKAYNFLHHYPHKNESIQFKDAPNFEKAKFGQGFQRRSMEKIWPKKEENRIKEWEDAMKRRIKHEAKRKQFLATKNNINGNLLTSDIPQQNERNMFQQKRKVTFTDKVSIREKSIRDKVSKNRFFNPELQNRPQIKRIIQNRQHFSSDIEIGKNDMKSNGMLDAFCGHGY